MSQIVVALADRDQAWNRRLRKTLDPSHKEHGMWWPNSSMGQVLRDAPKSGDPFWKMILNSTFPTGQDSAAIVRFVADNGSVRMEIADGGKKRMFPVNMLIGYYEVVAFGTIEPQSQRVYRLPVFWNHRTQRLDTYGGPFTDDVAKGRILAFETKINPNGSFHQTILAPEVGAECAPCHTTALKELPFASPGAYLETGVGCEACHGHSADHALARETRTQDPGVLSFLTKRDARGSRETIKPQFDAVCLNCHTHSMHWPIRTKQNQPVNFREKMFPFTPQVQRHSLDKFGRRTFGAAGELKNATFIGEEFTRSRCFLSGGIHCGTCHHVHANGSAPASALLRNRATENSICTKCHVKRDYGDKAHTKHSASQKNHDGDPTQCVTCHMPRTLNGIGGPIESTTPLKARSHRIDQLPATWLVASLSANSGPEEFRESMTSCSSALCHAAKRAGWFAERLSGWAKVRIK